MTAETIIQTAARCFNCSTDGIRSNNHRDRQHSDARRAVYMVLKLHHPEWWTYQQIADEFNRNSVNSVFQMIRRGRNYAKTDPVFAKQYEKMLNELIF